MASHEQACTRIAALFSSRWLRHYVSSKLRSDPAFPLAYEILASTDDAILDVGCGIGLLGFYLRERGLEQPIVGIDIDERKIRRAMRASDEQQYAGLTFMAGDVAQQLPPFVGNVVVLDLLHYLDARRQQEFLSRVANRVAPGAACVLRDCPGDGSARFRATYIAELFAQTISWNWRAPLHFPTVESIQAAFGEPEFKRDVMPAWGRTPFNNRLFIFQRDGCVAAPVLE
jgi:2-polyprenyl-3-methyl-5-hydroxy-6-metoxy-1,4-benzoquinol methylase